MLDSTTLLLLCSLPAAAAGALPVCCLPMRDSRLSKIGTMLIMLAVLALSAGVFLSYDGIAASRLARIYIPWIPSLGIDFHLAIDSLNVYLLLLTSLLFPVVLACSWNRCPSGSPLFLTLLLLLETGLLGTFLSQNLMLFFILWEAVLIPMFLLILVFGGEKRLKAARSFFLYTLAGSVLLLAAVLLLGAESFRQTGHWSFEFDVLYGLQLGWGAQLFVFAAVVLACAIKCPLFPFHSWLPLAYIEAPTAGAALMAGALSKMGAFGLLKLALPLCPQAVSLLAPCLALWAVVSLLYGAVLALRQEDFKKLVAYSSLSHMGYIVLGLFSLQQSAVQGALLQMLSHGVAVAGLFLALGLLEERLGAPYRELRALSSLAPRLAVLLMLLVLTSVALPLTSGFASEFLILFGAFQQAMAVWQAGAGAIPLIAVLLASTGMVLGAAYMLRFARTILFGTPRSGISVPDLTLREMLAFVPLVLLILWVGVWPSSVMEKAQGSLAGLTPSAAVSVPSPAEAASSAENNGGTHDL